MTTESVNEGLKLIATAIEQLDKFELALAMQSGEEEYLEVNFDKIKTTLKEAIDKLAV